MQQLQLQATYITLAANVVAAAIQEASLRAQIAAQLQIVSLNRQALEIARNQLHLGYIAEMELTQQEMNAALAQQALVPLQQQLEQTRDLLRALAGNTPDQDIEETFTLDSLHLPQELPLSLPSKLVEQRPDVRIAEAQLHYASAQYGVAIANTLPQFAITGAIGGMASSPTWMFKNGGGFFDLTASVAQTIFDGGPPARQVARGTAGVDAGRRAIPQRSDCCLAERGRYTVCHPIRRSGVKCGGSGSAGGGQDGRPDPQAIRSGCG
jgi:outer membrane protein TolC